MKRAANNTRGLIAHDKASLVLLLIQKSKFKSSISHWFYAGSVKMLDRRHKAPTSSSAGLGICGENITEHTSNFRSQFPLTTNTLQHPS